MREVTMRLKLTSSWMGSPAGSIVKVGERQAKSMLSRKIAKIIIEEEVVGNGKKTTEKKESSGSSIQAQQEKEIVGKLQKRDRDKMIKSSGVVNK